tara:strand:+ start:8450 stop:8668 length:219 start_codon:yes stop_codon:yes gene_type:complete
MKDEEKQYDLIVGKIIQLIETDRLNSRDDLKLLGIEKKDQKPIMDEIFQHLVLTSNEKTKMIKKFHRLGLLY